MSPRSAAAAIGRAFEDEVAYALNMAGVVYDKVGTTARPKWSKDHQVHFIAGKSMPDFVGCGGRLGRAFVFDAKVTSEDSWSLAASSQHQYDTLLRWATGGAVAFFLIEHRRPPLDRCGYILQVGADSEPLLRLPRFRFPVPGKALDLQRQAAGYPLQVFRVAFDNGQADCWTAWLMARLNAPGRPG